MRPQWEPPLGLRDPFVRRLRLDRATWTRAIRGRIPELRDVAAAHTMASYANRDGSNAHPGVARLVKDLMSSDKTVRRALASLIEAGWVTVSYRARRKLGEADVHCLSVPAPLAVEMELWTETSGAQWMERPTSEPKRPDAAVTGDRKKRPFPPVTVDRKKSVVPVTNGFVPVKSSVLPVTGDLPPGPIHQDLEHQSASRTPHHADARWRATTITVAMILDGIDLDDDLDLVDRIEDALHHHGLEVNDPQRLAAMVAEGRTEKAIAYELSEQRS